MSKLLLENIKVYERFIKKNKLYESNKFNFIQLGGSDGERNLDPFFSEDIEELTKQNEDYRRVLYTGINEQIVLMSIPPKDNIKNEIHESRDQFIRIEQGEGKAIIGKNEYILIDNTAFIIPAGVSHEVINTSESKPLKLYTIYSPPEHPDKLLNKTNPDKPISQIDLNHILIDSDSNNSVSMEIIRKQLDSEMPIDTTKPNEVSNKLDDDLLKGGNNRLDKKNIDYNNKYLDYKNKYLTLKKFISKYY